jgi:N-acetylglucosamine malate deacetylase 1
MKMYFFLLFSFAVSTAFPQSESKDTLKNILIVTAHPDDWEIAMGGTATLLQNKYHIHVLIASKGERGLSKEPSEKTAKLREDQSIEGCKRIHATLHFLGKMDGEIFADRNGVDSITKILLKLNPVMIFTHWPLDKPDHAAVSNMTTLALWKTGFVHDHQVYYFGVQLPSLEHFDPDLYVNITNVIDNKKELIRLHSLQADDEERLVNATIELDKMYGQLARCEYAEGFKTFNTIIGNRWNKKMKYSLLEL